MPSSFAFSADSSRLDRRRIHSWLSGEAYWAKGRPRHVQDAAIDASRNYGVWDAEGEQVAYARVVTDGVTFAWLCDVFVEPGVRGRGIGKMLVEGVIADLTPLGLKRVMLATADAHGLYKQYGFAPSEDPDRYLIRPMT
ncbi:GNAT family N-acetyltransferase [Microbacterium sp. SD291]|uniref:GNAT family N-acetyltransferase n=1 Tax=Microbacterium sp. SD291 TaxID=2782007 RepID=UPI001A967825|nr:GNAT family N-acetyltransferase [Microbacterium sp. SD291]MBO0979015.1 GNAT family N-acetyltransferase [Microbacterium sp. SD291]